MCAARLTLHAFILKMVRPGEVFVREDGEARLVEKFRLLTFLTILVEWTGRYRAEAACIDWAESSMTIKSFLWPFWRRSRGGKVIKAPPASEKLRKVPWKVVRVDEKHGVVFELTET